MERLNELHIQLTFTKCLCVIFFIPLRVLGITGFLDFVHHYGILKSKKRTFHNWICFCPQGMGELTSITGSWTKSKKPVIQSVARHHQNPIESTTQYNYTSLICVVDCICHTDLVIESPGRVNLRLGAIGPVLGRTL
jgi:hypothetical protein